MSEIKFACPSCQQHIQCDEGYGGVEITCPACNARMIVPGNAPAAVSAPPQSLAPPPMPQSAPGGAASKNCPSCGAPLARGAVICTRCGFNMATGQRMSPGIAAACSGNLPRGQEKWYQNPYVYLGVLAAMFAALYGMAMTGNPAFKLAFLGALLLYIVAMYVVVVVFAFKAGATQGILSMICGIYQLYFVYKESDSPARPVDYP